MATRGPTELSSILKQLAADSLCKPEEQTSLEAIAAALLFTAPAARRWRELGPQRQMLILNKVWCVGCEVATTIVEPAGRIVRGDLVIEGTCLRCGGVVRRVIEGG